jgi:3',5'-cyclic AMP phosphodiesterase CpdA
MTRRDLLKTAGMALAATPLNAAGPSFSFVHFTDTHIQPELRAADGCRMCFQKINRTKADFAICGGDLVFDAAAQQRPRATMLYGMYGEALKAIEMPVYSTIGNHDVFGTAPGSGVEAGDPQYGKKMYEDRIGKRYYSFAHKGWRFLVLDSISSNAGGGLVGKIDEEQIEWLKNELAGISKETPLVAVTHIPLMSGVMQVVPGSWAGAEGMLVTNSREVLDLFWPYKLKAVLQGHTHIRETVSYNGCQFITSGAVSGNWWKGLRLGHPEGYGVLAVRGDEISWRYETYGFQAAPGA